MKTLILIPWPNDPIAGLPEGVDSKALNNGVELRGYVDVVRNEHLFLEATVQAEKDGYDAVLSMCFADSGIEIARKLVDIPVLGACRVGMHLAGILGRKVCVLQPDYELNARTTLHTIEGYGLADKAVICNPHVNSMEIVMAAQEYATTGKVTDAITKCVDAAVKSFENDDTDAVLFGSGAMVGTEGVLTDELKKRGCDVPVINPLSAALGLANVLHELKLTQSRLAYPRGV